jgi:hypothetical protein
MPPFRLPLGAGVVAAGACLVTTVVRFLAQVGFPNDHFLYLAPAQQMLYGEWPSRDFVDPGTPLMYVASAAAQLLVTPPLLAEAWLVSAAFGVAAALTLLAAFRVSGRLSMAVLVATVEVALFPRSYHYPKLLVYAAAVLALLAYVDAPTRRRAALLAGCVVVAFLFRHDHGVYLGAAAIVATVMARPGWPGAVRRTGDVLLFGVVFSAPYFVCLAATTGLAAHVASGLAYSAAEAERTALGLPALDLGAIVTADGARVCLFYAFHAIPVLALSFLVRRIIRDRSDASRREAARIGPLIILAIVANVAMLRDPLQARLPDVAVPVGVLVAWLLPQAWSIMQARYVVRLVVAAAVLLGLVAMNVVGLPAEQLDRADLPASPARIPGLLRQRIAELKTRLSPRNFSSGALEDIVPFLDYVRRCTAPEHRLFIAGELPEIYVLVGRPFAGGQPALRRGYFDTTEDQERLVLRLRRQQVPLAIVVTESDASGFPVVMQELQTRFTPLAEIRCGEGRLSRSSPVGRLSRWESIQ